MDDRGIVLKYNGFISKIGYPGNFCYLADGFTLPEFKAENIEKITLTKAQPVVLSNFSGLDGNRENAIKYIQECEELSPDILEITDGSTITKFVDEINENGSTDKFCADLTEREGIKDKFYFKVYFKSENMPFYLSVYTSQNLSDESSYAEIVNSTQE